MLIIFKLDGRGLGVIPLFLSLTTIIRQCVQLIHGNILKLGNKLIGDYQYSIFCAEK